MSVAGYVATNVDGAIDDNDNEDGDGEGDWLPAAVPSMERLSCLQYAIYLMLL